VGERASHLPGQVAASRERRSRLRHPGRLVKTRGLLEGAPGQDAKLLGADCLAGAWAGDAASRGGLSREDFDQALVTLFEGRDAEGNLWFDESAHGTGYERNRSFGGGVEGGATACITPAG
jgi:hypothetical protein